jgi:hypothetical protein
MDGVLKLFLYITIIVLCAHLWIATQIFDTEEKGINRFLQNIQSLLIVLLINITCLIANSINNTTKLNNLQTEVKKMSEKNRLGPLI